MEFKVICSFKTSPDDVRFVETLLVDALKVLRKHLDLEVAFISEFKLGRRIFRWVDAEAEFLPLSPGDSDPVEQSFCKRVVDGQLPELLISAQDHPEAVKLPVTAAMPVGAHLSVPIRVDGEVFGTLCCFGRLPKSTLDERDLAVVKLYADLVGRLLQGLVGPERKLLAKRERVRDVLDKGLFYMVYQPIIHVGMNKVVGYEALTRFTMEPLRSPDQWFNEAGEVGLQSDLELATVQMALGDISHFPEGTYLSFNVSPQTILEGAVLTRLDGYPLDRLMLEVTEHSSISDYGIIAEKLEPLRQRGLRLAVDDAGAGYASFRHILKLKPDVIKLDASLVAAIDKDAGTRALASALVRFAADTGSRVVAEGVETEQEMQVLRALNVNKAQGYLLGRPSRLEALQSVWQGCRPSPSQS